MEKLVLFFTRIKDLNFWQRLFSWASVRSLSYEAYEQYKSISAQTERQQLELEAVKNRLTQLEAEKTALEQQSRESEKTLLKKEHQLENVGVKTEELTGQNAHLTARISKFETIEEQRKTDYEKKIAQLDQVKKDLDEERHRLNNERVQEKEEEFERMKRQWADHEEMVAQRIKQLCQLHLIRYVEEPPFRGKPDNTVEICDEYVIFDAKSPANDDLTNFPKYIKAQTDSIKKYTNQEAVKKDIFLVIPSNTVHAIAQMSYNMGDYHVYVITLDALEPILLSLKKIEEYEFAEQLSPEDRDNICRVIGKFAHTTKRKIQIDQFFANQFIELLVKCKNDLPESLLQSVIEFEKAEKLNPPTERRAKQILTKELREKNDAINAEAQVRQIAIPDTFEEVKKLE